VIATLVGGVVDLVGDERGVGIRPNDVDAFAAGLGELVKNRSLRERLGRNGFEFVNHNYRKERLLEDIKDLYGELLSRERVAHSELRVAKYS
jgi:glycosyltransferase involved in cell wall biosynthesis